MMLMTMIVKTVIMTVKMMMVTMTVGRRGGEQASGTKGGAQRHNHGPEASFSVRHGPGVTRDDRDD